jgi:hypothetical protein
VDAIGAKTGTWIPKLAETENGTSTTNVMDQGETNEKKKEVSGPGARVL